jgi:protein-S-isoprenylcysteine O-methyltransferase Ste14
VPKGIDEGPRAAVPVAVAIDLLLLLLFAVQHDLFQSPGGTYAAYRIRVPALIPRPRPLLRRHAYGT